MKTKSQFLQEFEEEFEWQYSSSNGGAVDYNAQVKWLSQMIDEISDSVPCQEYDAGLQQKILNWQEQLKT